MARSGGGATYVLNLLPRLAAVRSGDRIRLWLRNAELAAALPRLENLEVEVLPEAGWLERFRFLLLDAAPRARAWGADLYFSTAEYTPPRPLHPLVASFRNWNVFTRLELGWPLSQRLRLGVLRQLAGHSARVCDRILFVSEDSAQAIGSAIGLPPAKRAVVPHGIDAGAWSRAGVQPARLEGGRPYLLSVSSIYRYKNFVRLIEAWSRVAERRADAPDLVIIGDDQDREYRSRMEQARAATGRLASRIHLLGAVPYAEIRGWYAGASLFVFPSYLESFGHPLLEAMAMEIPVLASDLPVFREIAGEVARFADPHDSDALARALDALLAEPAGTAALGRRGRERALAFSWDRSARGHSLLFDALLTGGASAP